MNESRTIWREGLCQDVKLILRKSENQKDSELLHTYLYEQDEHQFILIECMMETFIDFYKELKNHAPSLRAYKKGTLAFSDMCDLTWDPHEQEFVVIWAHAKDKRKWLDFNSNDKDKIKSVSKVDKLYDPLVRTVQIN